MRRAAPTSPVVPVILPRLAAAFLVIWLVRNLLVTATGLPVVLQTGPIQAPGAARQPWGDPLQKAFIRLDGRIGRGDRVLVRVQDPTVDLSMVYLWSTYWLYPREIRATASAESTDGYNDLVLVNTVAAPPPGWRLVLDDSSGGIRVAAFHRPGG